MPLSSSNTVQSVPEHIGDVDENSDISTRRKKLEENWFNLGDELATVGFCIAVPTTFQSVLANNWYTSGVCTSPTYGRFVCVCCVVFYKFHVR